MNTVASRDQVNFAMELAHTRARFLEDNSANIHELLAAFNHALQHIATREAVNKGCVDQVTGPFAIGADWRPDPLPKDLPIPRPEFSARHLGEARSFLEDVLFIAHARNAGVLPPQLTRWRRALDERGLLALPAVAWHLSRPKSMDQDDPDDCALLALRAEPSWHHLYHDAM